MFRFLTVLLLALGCADPNTGDANDPLVGRWDCLGIYSITDDLYFDCPFSLSTGSATNTSIRGLDVVSETEAYFVDILIIEFEDGVDNRTEVNRFPAQVTVLSEGRWRLVDGGGVVDQECEAMDDRVTCTGRWDTRDRIDDYGPALVPRQELP